MRPVLMPPNRLAHFYLGGEAITTLRHVPAPAERSPEEWIASATTRSGEAHVGLSALPDGRLLRDAVRADPTGWLGPQPQPGGPGDVGILVKLLDAGQRLPVHVHPDRDFATAHLGSCYGKTEAWYVLATRGPSPQVHLGFSQDVSHQDLRRAVDEQDSAWMLQRMNALDVRRGDVLLVPAGTAHAIGTGVFVVEVQEPTDFSLLLEWQGFAEPGDAFLGLEVDDALSLVDRRATGPEALQALLRHVPPERRSPAPQPLMPPSADPFFRADLLAPAGAAAVAVLAGFGVVVVLAGTGRLEAGDGGTAVSSGDVLAVPHAAGDWQVTGDLTAVLCRPGDAARGTT